MGSLPDGPFAPIAAAPTPSSLIFLTDGRLGPLIAAVGITDDAEGFGGSASVVSSSNE
jgi:hypothetical protein